MKKRFIAWLLILGTWSYQAHAQLTIPVMDNLLLESIEDNTSKQLQQAGLLEVIREMTEETKDNVENIESLQYDYREFLRQTTSTAGLRLSDAEPEHQAVGLVVSSSNHLDDYTVSVL